MAAAHKRTIMFVCVLIISQIDQQANLHNCSVFSVYSILLEGSQEEERQMEVQLTQ